MKKLLILMLPFILAGCNGNHKGIGGCVYTMNLDTIGNHEYVVVISNSGGVSTVHSEDCWCNKGHYDEIFVGDTDEGV